MFNHKIELVKTLSVAVGIITSTNARIKYHTCNRLDNTSYIHALFIFLCNMHFLFFKTIFFGFSIKV